METNTIATSPVLPQGLSSDEAGRRLADVGPNTLPPPQRPRLVVRLLAELREPMALLLVGAAVVAGGLLGEYVDAVAILAIVVLDAVIALVQQGRANRALDALAELEAPEARVLRDGRLHVVGVAQVVPGDVVLVQSGDRVPADLVMDHGDGLEVDEAVLTGESLPVARRAGEPLHAGTLVLTGAGRGVVTATGADTGLGAIAQQLGDLRREPTPLQRQLQGLTSTLGLAAAGLAAATFLLLVVVDRGGGMEEAFLAAVALAVAAVPEGLAAVATVALALGVSRMARRGAIVRRLPAVETLGSTDVLVVDKTGTLTRNEMALAGIVSLDDDDRPVAGSGPRVQRVLALCNDATLSPPTGDPMERALLVGVDPTEADRLQRRWPRVATGSFTPERRRMATLHVADDVEAPLLLLKGAPEAVLPLCSRVAHNAAERPLTDRGVRALEHEVARRADRGERVLAVAERALDQLPDDAASEEHDLVLLALVALRDPPRSSAADSVAAVRAAGVRLVMATGDHEGTARAIAREVGLGDTSRTGAQLSQQDIPDDPSDVDVWARVDPGQKLALVERLRALGHVVAMTGDGVNDAPALHRADIGVALGETGSDVAREASDLVVTDDDLATIVAAVHEGRGIYDNLRKVVHYLVTSNLAEVATVVVALLAFPALGLPLHPLQLLWVNLLTDGLPALALGVDPVDPALLRQPPRRRGAALLDRSTLRVLAARAVVLSVGALGALWIALDGLDLEAAEARTMLFSAVVAAQVAYVFVVRGSPTSARPHGTEVNRWLAVAIASSLALQVAVVHVGALATVFDTRPLSPLQWLVVGVCAVAPTVALLGWAALRRWLVGRGQGTTTTGQGT